MKKVVSYVLVLALGFAGGLVFGFTYGKKSAEADLQLRTVQHARTVDLNRLPEAPAQSATSSTKDNAENASVTPTPQGTAAAPAPATAGEATVYEISADDSALDFTGYKSVAGQKVGMNGFFGAFSGTASLSGDDLSSLKFKVEVDLASVNTENAILTGVLKGEAFFNIAQYPKATVESVQVRAEGDQYLADVAWTMKGKTVGYQIPLKVQLKGNELRATGEVLVDRNQWNIGYAEYEGVSILPDVRVTLDIVAKKK
ncbi:MAG TPA: YceI family protein [Candidatus Hydrogenedentes bacterium]|nr:YceI family protein [Candidatus Hydrogenedentota bacterium]HOK90940.1 YceI family protein [Candidatus Hydrogenedentota bacterium]